MVAKGVDVEALSPRDVNARPRANELKSKATAQLKANKEKEHPPPPPPNVTEPPSADRKDGAVYQVGKLLGRGGFAICHEAVLAGTRKRYALKIVKRQMQPKMEQKFQTELQIHSKMRHINIVQFFRAFTFENSTYLALELCPNGSLMDMVKRRKGVTEPEVRFYSVQIAGAIKYMHSKGIIHRDLKMGNIFLDRHMNAKIGDFGLAALLVTGKDMQTIRRTTLCGTPNYIAPEILQKGKQGHDHMVDIWSLGIIMFAMLTSKPPFQSSTTDEIYRRAKERDYEWPADAVKYISQAAKDLVASMLEDADRRPEPDTIVQHPFFVTGYMPVQSDMTSRLRERAPEEAKFYDSVTTYEQQLEAFQTLKNMCKECGVGPWSETQLIIKPVWREVAAEESAGLTPAIPLAEDIVYRPFEDWVKENELQSRFAAPPPSRPIERYSNLSIKSDESNSGISQKAPAGLMRAPPQSFAAQQRAQNKPANANSKAVRTADMLAPEAAGTVRPRTKREIPLGNAWSLESREQAQASRGPTRLLRGQLPQSKTVPLAEKAKTPAPATRVEAPKLAEKEPAKNEKLSLFSPSEYREQVPGSQPEVVLGRLRKLQAELERALNSRSMAIVSAKDTVRPSPRLVVKWVDYTNKFGLGYILDDGSIGCTLRSVPANDSPKAGLLPPACLLIHDAERHAKLKDDVNYVDRHQILPMTEGINFYESSGEDGLIRVRVSPEQFRVPVGSNGAVGKLSPGNDAYDHRKRERVVVWKKFANYMLAYGRELELFAEQDVSAPTIRDPSAAPSDVVTFYQRFGDVGCWIFGDGHFQFNFPDHTKIVLDASGTYCHTWLLPEEAAQRLATTGTMDETALDGRRMFHYPLQTLLNFGVTSKTTARSASNPLRRRPEIRPDEQGIPAANDFRRKIEFIKKVVREWVANGGIGNSDMSRAGRLRWTGARETKNVQVPAKHIWVTIGARGGDERYSAYVDPRKPEVLGPDIDENAKPGT